MREADVLKQIKDYLDAKQLFNMRVNTGRFFGEGTQHRWVFSSHSLGQGCADILCQASNGRLWWIEVKSENGKQSFAQKAFEKRMTEKFRHRYVIARSVDDLEGLE